MTTLDQAFIRAYSHQGIASQTPSPDSPRPAVPLSVALAGPVEDKPVVWSAKMTIDSLLSGMQEPAHTDHRAAGVALAEEFTTTPAAPCWRPMLQVDHFLWPKTCDRLGAEAHGAVDKLADALSDLVGQGRRIIGLGSCAPGEGVTTLVLAAGRRLVERGLRVALADANLADPQLARSLGLLPQVGWEDGLAGRLPLEEVVIESLGDRLAVLPVREPPADLDRVLDETSMAASLDTLATHHDVVLVDLGSLECSPSPVPAFAGSPHLDAVVLVHNVRLTTPDRLANVQRSLAAAGVSQAGVVENFVAN